MIEEKNCYWILERSVQNYNKLKKLKYKRKYTLQKALTSRLMNSTVPIMKRIPNEQEPENNIQWIILFGCFVILQVNFCWTLQAGKKPKTCGQRPEAEVI